MHSSSSEERVALVALLMERPDGVTWARITDAVLEHGSAICARAALVDSENALFDISMDPSVLSSAARKVAEWEQAGLHFLTILDETYPARVRDIQEAPPFLFASGEIRPDDVAVSVVGSRDASDRGIDMARAISDTLVRMQVTVVSGLAHGIDTAAHVSALDRGGRAVAVIGTGINGYYPASNSALQQRIAKDGLVLSQFWPDAPPQQQNVPMRNAVMSGYGVATIVVEAGEQSGARIQARKAVQHGRPVILSDLVVSRTEWGKQLLAAQPNVYQVDSTREVADLVRRLIDHPVAVSEALDQIAV